MAQQTDKQKQEKLIIEIMDADAKDGLYDHIGDTNKMVTMKLYTEEQVRKILKSTHIHTDNDVDMILPQFTPIELPSDEEVLKESIKRMEEWYGEGSETQIDAHNSGAKWMRDKILNK